MKPVRGEAKRLVEAVAVLLRKVYILPTTALSVSSLDSTFGKLLLYQHVRLAPSPARWGRVSVFCKNLRSIKFALRCVAARLLLDMQKTKPSQPIAEAFVGQVLGQLLDLPSTGPGAFAAVAGMLAQARAFKEISLCQVQEAMGSPGTVYMRHERIVVGELGPKLHRAQVLALEELAAAVSLSAGVTSWLALPWQLEPSNDERDFADANFQVINMQVSAVMHALGVAHILELVNEGLEAVQLEDRLERRLVSFLNWHEKFSRTVAGLAHLGTGAGGRATEVCKVKYGGAGVNVLHPGVLVFSPSYSKTSGLKQRDTQVLRFSDPVLSALVVGLLVMNRAAALLRSILHAAHRGPSPMPDLATHVFTQAGKRMSAAQYRRAVVATLRDYLGLTLAFNQARHLFVYVGRHYYGRDQGAIEQSLAEGRGHSLETENQTYGITARIQSEPVHAVTKAFRACLSRSLAPACGNSG